MKQTILITVRYSSSRLPGKCLLQLGDFSVLGHCIARARAAGFNVIVCTGTDSADIEIVRESVKYHSEVLRSL